MSCDYKPLKDIKCFNPEDLNLPNRFTTEYACNGDCYTYLDGKLISISRNGKTLHENLELK